MSVGKGQVAINVLLPARARRIGVEKQEMWRY